ncbi:MAG: zinc ribbon domain-containing protein [Clostridia bacterium]|nr:zinc ribbon domain-containing protein [Clostridia bacterium]
MIISCPKCGQKTAMLKLTCEHCGYKAKRCEECGNLIDFNSSVCDYCGIDVSSMQELKEEKVEKKKQDLQDTGTDLITFAEKNHKKFRLIGSLLLLAGVIFFAIGFMKLLDFGNYQNKSLEEMLDSLANVDELENQIRVFLILALVSMFASLSIGEIAPLIYAETVFNKVQLSRFDYKSYYKNCLVEDENGNFIVDLSLTSDNTEDLGDVRLVESIAYATDSTEKNKAYFRKALPMILLLAACVFIYLGLMPNIETYISNVIFMSAEEFSFTFSFNQNLIIASAFLVLYIIIHLFIPSEIATAEKFIGKLLGKK